MPRRTGRKGSGRTSAPSEKAIAAAAAPACWAARPPCLSGKAVPSPAAQTAFDPEHGAMLVGREEALAIVRQPADPGAHESGHRDDPLDLDGLAVRDDEAARTGAERHRVGHDGDAALGQQAPDVRRDAGPEGVERSRTPA